MGLNELTKMSQGNSLCVDGGGESRLFQEENRGATDLNIPNYSSLY